MLSKTLKTEISQAKAEMIVLCRSSHPSLFKRRVTRLLQGGTFGKGNWDQPKHTTCGGEPLPENPTYSAFWSGFGVRCLRLQRLASPVGFWTTARLGASQNLPTSGRKSRAWRVLRLAARLTRADAES